MIVDYLGFRSKSSSLTYLIGFFGKATGRIDRSKEVEVCLPDLQEAFVSVNQGSRDDKVKAFGVKTLLNNRRARSMESRPFRVRDEGYLLNIERGASRVSHRTTAPPDGH